MATPLLDHVGIAVRDAEAVEALFATLLEATTYKVEDVPAQGVRTYFIRAGCVKLELLESLDPSSPIARYLEKNREGMHHLAFEVPHIQATFNRVRNLGFEPLSEKPVPGADGKLIFFLHPRQTHGILIEFCQSARLPLEATRVPFEDGSLAVFELGDASLPPLVILHGAAGCTQMETEPLARRLSASYRVYALDFAAHGKSDPFPDHRFAPELFIENVRAVFDFFGLNNAYLFGFSLGGFIGLSFASLYPERLRKIAVHGVNLVWNESLIDTMLARLEQEQIIRQSPELARYLADMHGGDQWTSLFERMKDYTVDIVSRQAPYKRATRVAVPTHVSAVDEDDLFPVDAPVRLYKSLPDASLAIIPGKRHALQNVNLDVLTQLLKQHFN